MAGGAKRRGRLLTPRRGRWGTRRWRRKPPPPTGEERHPRRRLGAPRARRRRRPSPRRERRWRRSPWPYSRLGTRSGTASPGSRKLQTEFTSAETAIQTQRGRWYQHSSPPSLPTPVFTCLFGLLDAVIDRPAGDDGEGAVQREVEDEEPERRRTRFSGSH